MLPDHWWRFTFLTSVDARQALDRVAASGTFRDAENLRHLVLYLGEATLEGRAGQLKEYTIGVEVLGRPAHYEPRVDSSARMLAARLRRKLEDYYRGEGAADTVRIGFPKGSFKLTFDEAGPPAAEVPTDSPRASETKWKLIAAGCAVACAAMAVYAVALKVRMGASAPSAVELTPEVESIWQPLLDSKAPVVVSFGSPLFVSVGGWMVRHWELNDWSQATSHEGLKRFQNLLGAERIVPYYEYAGSGDVHGAFLVGRLLGARTSQLTLKRGSVLSWEDIQNNHLVFIGNGKNQEKLRYVLEHLELTLDALGVHCRNPRPGEPADYRNGPSGASAFEYGLLSVVPGSRKGRYMILLSGNDTAAIWGMAELVTNPRFADPLVSRLRRGGKMPRAYQAVIRIGLNQRVPVTLDYVAHRELPADRPPLK